MPIKRVQFPDGSIHRIEVPEGATNDQIIAFVQEQHPAAQGTIPANQRAIAPKGGMTRPDGQFVNSVGRIPQPGAADPTEGMSAGGKFVAGVGKSVMDTGLGLRQLYANVADRVSPLPQSVGGLVSGQRPSRSAAIQQEVNQRARQDDALMRTGAGVMGDFGGQTGQMFVPVGDAAKVLGITGKLTAPAVNGAYQGSVFAATQPVQSGQTRTGNVLAGGLFGAGGGVMAQGTSALAKGAVSRLDGVSKALAQRAEQYGIPLTTSQLSDSPMARTVFSQMERLPFSGARKANEARQVAMNRAVGSTFGAPEDKITQDVFAKAANRIGNEFETIAARNTLPASPQLLTNLGRVRAEAQRLAGKDTAGKVNNWIGELLSKADAQGNIPGAAYKSFDSRIGKELMAGGEGAHYLGQVREAARTAMDGAISPKDKAAWDLARKQWAALKTVEPLVAKSPKGDISPQALMGRVTADKAGKARMARGNSGTLGDLAQIGQRFLKESPNSGTADRALVNLGVLGGLGGLTQGGYIDPETSGLIALGLLGNRAGLGVLNSRALAQGGSRTLNGLARVTQPAPKLLPAWALAYRNED